MRYLIVSVFLGFVLTACTLFPESSEEAAAEFGICYDARSCPAGQENTFSVTKNSCAAANGKSWKGSVSGCVNL